MDDNKLKPKVYIGASRIDRLAAERIAAVATAAGFDVVSTWHTAELPSSDLGLDWRAARTEGEKNIEQMRVADLAVFIRPSTPAGRGVWFDMGVCVALDFVPVWLCFAARLVGGGRRVVERQSIYEELADELILHELELTTKLQGYVVEFQQR